MKTTLRLLGILLLAASMLMVVQPAQADVAPPEMPPGSTLLPGDEQTQVSMLAEEVVLTVSQDPGNDKKVLARTVASFTMRNLGDQAETMQVRFPLRFVPWENNIHPEISDLKVKVNGFGVATRREMQPFWDARDPIPWSVFQVSFPPAQDVSIQVSYTVYGTGYYPYEALQYVLETGAGWKGNIGSADIIIKLPYEANEYNVVLDYGTGYSLTSPGSSFSGNELRWHLEDFEPTFENNIEVSLVTPSLWKAIQNEKAAVAANPKDGEAWGRLAKGYKQLTRIYKGYPREDEVGYQLYLLSSEAYEKCLALLPRDSLWHTGYAELLWNEYYFNKTDPRVYLDETLFPRALTHLQTAIQLDPKNELARQILDEIFNYFPEALNKNGDEFDFLALTAMPPTYTPYVVPTLTMPATWAPAITPSMTSTVEVQPVAATMQPTPESVPQKRPLPICGGAAMVVGVVVVFMRAGRIKKWRNGKEFE